MQLQKMFVLIVVLDIIGMDIHVLSNVLKVNSSTLKIINANAKRVSLEIIIKIVNQNALPTLLSIYRQPYASV